MVVKRYDCYDCYEGSLVSEPEPDSGLKSSRDILLESEPKQSIDYLEEVCVRFLKLVESGTVLSNMKLVFCVNTSILS